METTHTTAPLATYTPEAAGFHELVAGTYVDHVDGACPAIEGTEAPTVEAAAWPCSACWIYDEVHGGIMEQARDLPTGGGAAATKPTPGGPGATEKQVAFIAKLLAERGMEFDRDEVEALTKKQASNRIDFLLKTVEPVATPTAPANVRPNRYAARCADCGVTVEEGAGSLTKNGARWETRHIGGCPEQAPATTTTTGGFEVEEGQFHQVGDDLRRVRRTRSGQLIGQRVHVHGFHDIEWEYLGKAGLRGMTAETLLTAEQAAAFGTATGTCVFCSRILDDERSVNAGYGPVCAGNYGLPWGD